MKKVLVAVAMVLGMGTSVAFAQDVKDSTVVEAQATPVEFVKMDAATLPQAVVDALAKDNVGATIKEAFVAEKPEGKVFKVIITTKDGQEVTAILNEREKRLRNNQSFYMSKTREGSLISCLSLFHSIGPHLITLPSLYALWKGWLSLCALWDGTSQRWAPRETYI